MARRLQTAVLLLTLLLLPLAGAACSVRCMGTMTQGSMSQRHCARSHACCAAHHASCAATPAAESVVVGLEQSMVVNVPALPVASISLDQPPSRMTDGNGNMPVAWPADTGPVPLRI